MSQVNIHEAKSNLSKLIERVSRGEEIVIARAGKPERAIPVLSPATGHVLEKDVVEGAVKFEKTIHMTNKIII